MLNCGTIVAIFTSLLCIILMILIFTFLHDCLLFFIRILIPADEATPFHSIFFTHNGQTKIAKWHKKKSQKRKVKKEKEHKNLDKLKKKFMEHFEDMKEPPKKLIAKKLFARGLIEFNVSDDSDVEFLEKDDVIIEKQGRGLIFFFLISYFIAILIFLSFMV